MATQARSIASLTISFGLVAIPVKLYSATVSSERISFNLLRQKDGSRVKQQYVAVNDGKLVERSEMVKGYEFAKDQYVMFSPEELKALEDTTSHAIDIGQFVPLDSVDPLYFDGTYYLAPDKGGAKPYTLLATALRKSQQCAVGRWISRGKEHIVVIRAIAGRPGDAPTAFQGRGSRPQGPRDRSGAGVGTGIEAGAATHRPSGREALRSERILPMSTARACRRRFRRKVEGKEVSLAEGPVSAKGGNVIDLMEALRASIDARGSKATDLKERKAPKRAAAQGSSRKSARR